MKEGDRVYHIGKGYKKIRRIDGCVMYLDGVTNTYLVSSGKEFCDDKHPTIFKDYDSMLYYFSRLRSIDLEEELKKLKPIPFKFGEKHFAFDWMDSLNRLSITGISYTNQIGVVLFASKDELLDLCDKCNSAGITKEEFTKTYMEVFYNE